MTEFFKPVPPPIPPSETSKFIGDFGLFFQSGIEAAGPEMLGFDPSRSVARFREENPIGSVVSQMLGIGLPLVVAPELAFAKAPQLFRILPMTKQLLRSASLAKRAQKPFKAAALRAAAIELPFQLGRVGLTGALNTEKTPEIAQRAAFDLAAIPVSFGVFAGLRGVFKLPKRVAGFEQRVQKAFPDFNINGPPQRKLDDLLKIEAEVAAGTRVAQKAAPEQAMQDLMQLRNILKELVVREVPGNVTGLSRSGKFPARQSGIQFIGPLARTATKLSSTINSIFKTVKRKKYSTYKLFHDSRGTLGGIKDRAKLDEVLSGLPDHFESTVQFPRLIVANTDEGAKALEKTFSEGLGVGSGLFKWRREKNGGAYIMAVKVQGLARKSFEGDEYLLFKTDRLGLYAPKGMRDANKRLAAGVFDPVIEERRLVKLQANEYTQMVEKEMQLFEKAPVLGTPTQRVGTMKALARQAMPKQLLKGLGSIRGEMGAVAGDIDLWLRRFAYPSLVQFSNNVQAARAFGTAKLAFSKATSKASEFLDGKPVINLEGSDAKFIYAGKREGGMSAFIHDAETSLEGDLIPAWRVIVEGKTLEEAAESGLSSRAMEILTRLHEEAQRSGKEMADLASISTRSRFTPRQDHFLISSTWTGTHRVRLIDSEGRLVAVASGNSKAGVIEEANNIIAAVVEETGETLSKAFHRQRPQEDILAKSFSDRDAIFQVGHEGLEDLELVKMLRTDKAMSSAVASGRVRALERTPLFARPRRGVKGATIPLTKKDFEGSMRRAMVGREKFKAQLSLSASPRFQKTLSEIQENSPEVFKQLENRLNDLMGIRGPVVQAIENMIDTPLRAVGITGGTKIIRQLNRIMFSQTLGFIDLGFPAINAIQFIQTAVPEMSYIMTSAPEVLQKYYSWHVISKGAKIRGVGGTVDMFKLLGRSFKEIIKPDPELAAARMDSILDGHLKPRFLEEYSPQSDFAVGLKKLVAGEQGFADTIMKISEFLPAKSEEFSRIHAHTLGWIIGRDFIGATGEGLRRIANEFTDRTMFLYGQADRARIMAGAVGSGFGLFKNWTSHFTALMLGYAGEGVARNNWKPLLWMMAGTGTLAGIGGLPLYGVADIFSRVVSDKSVMDNLYSAFGTEDDTTIADAMFYGLPALAGVSLQSRGAAPGADFGRDVGFLFSIALMDRLNAGGRALEAGWDFYEATGQHPMNSEKFRLNFMRAVWPRTIYRGLSLAEDYGVRSMRSGNLLIKEQSIIDAGLFISGITPLRTEKLLDAHRKAFEDQEHMRTLTSTLGAALANAELNRDHDQVTKLFFAAAKLGIADRIMSSAKAHYRNQTQGLVDRQFDDWAHSARRRLIGLER